MARPLAALAALFAAVALAAAPLWAEAHKRYEPLSQRDIDAYIYALPRLAQYGATNPQRAARLLSTFGLTKSRLAYVATKIAIAQTMATGALSQKRAEGEVAAYLLPNDEEVALVNRNLYSLKLAQETARRSGAAQ